MRLFVSVDLDGLEDAVASVQESLRGRSGLNPTDPAQAHVTLKFLGDVDAGRLPDLTDALAAALEEAGVSPFESEFGGLGVFPHLDYISVVWLGVRDGSRELRRLHESIEARTVALGFDPKDHKFTPHVTLARMDHAGAKEAVQNYVTGSDPTAGRMTVEEVRLTESTLTDSGPVYETVERFEL